LLETTVHIVRPDTIPTIFLRFEADIGSATSLHVRFFVISSLPVPVSPLINTVASLGATIRTIASGLPFLPATVEREVQAFPQGLQHVQSNHFDLASCTCPT
jgi:hypothetical protein